MTIHETVLKCHELVATDTIAFAFEKPAGQQLRARSPRFGNFTSLASVAPT